MQRFVALLRSAADAAPISAEMLPCSEAGWRSVIATADAMVVCRDLKVQISLAGGAPVSIILGELFDAEGAPTHFDGPRTGVGADWRQALLSGAWGAYVALSWDAQSRAWSMFRDPSGRIPCFFATLKGWLLFFSHLEDATLCGWKSAGIDWPCLTALLQDPRLRDGRTALAGVEELLPGQSMGGANRVRGADWSPTRFALMAPLEDRDAARAALGAAVRVSVKAWASRYQRILHLLSGGLDSSVVLACLAEIGAGEKVSCLNFTQGAGSELDEARYAIEAAARAGVALVENRLEPHRVKLERAGALICAPRPLGYAYSIDNDDLELKAARAWNAEACFSAAGGDGLFYQLRARTFCADYLLRHGPGLRAAGIALDNARLARISFWTSARAGVAYAYGGKSFDPERGARNPYLADGVLDESAGWLSAHSWFAGAQELSPGKRLHLWAVLDCLNLYYPYRRAEIADTVFPLITQPVIETVLRIPSYVLTSGGRDRTLLREAFVGQVPATILNRRSKGAMDGYYASMCAANAPFIRERLLDGVLAARGLLDRGLLEKTLPRGGDPADGHAMLLLHLFAAEVWASAWASPPAT